MHGIIHIQAIPKNNVEFPKVFGPEFRFIAIRK